jgi:hypothetical protein
LISRQSVLAILALVLFSFLCKALFIQGSVLAYNLHNLLPYSEVLRLFPAGF